MPSLLKLVRFPRSLTATLAALPSISENPFLDSCIPDSLFRFRESGNFGVGRGALILCACLLVEINSCAPAHIDLSVFPIYVARVHAAPFARIPARPFLSSSVNASPARTLLFSRSTASLID